MQREHLISSTDRKPALLAIPSPRLGAPFRPMVLQEGTWFYKVRTHLRGFA